MSSVKEIGIRLKTLEEKNGITLYSSPLIDKLEADRKNKQIQIINKVESVAQQEAKKQNINFDKIFDVIDFVVTFVEKIGSYVPEIIELVGGLLLGEHKFVLAVQIITHLIGDITSAVSNIGVKDLIDKTVEMKFNKAITDNSNGTQTKTYDKSTLTTVDKNFVFPSNKDANIDIDNRQNKDEKKDSKKKTSKKGFLFGGRK